MADHEIRDSSTTDGLPVAPSMGPVLASARMPHEEAPVGWRVVGVSAVALGVGVAAGFIAEALLHLIYLFTNLAFYGRFGFENVPPTTAALGAWTIAVPVAGALVIGVMARYGSAAIRGHGIPEVMERVLHGKSRISPRLLFLKPLSSAIAIGTGGPFGAEGPIIATGGAFGSLVGQTLRITADERKTLLAAGAAAGMAATFGTPMAAVLLAVELLLFEYRPRSVVPVALAASAATAVRWALVGAGPVFAMPALAALTWEALAVYAVIGALLGLVSVGVTRAVYAIEDGFERLPVHWMWWPALGAAAVGVVGYVEPRTLGVGYYLIEEILSGELVGAGLVALVGLKFLSWSLYLGSGTSGGTLAPLFIIGGGIGALLGGVAAGWFPEVGLVPGVAGLVGMAAIFAGASHAFLASVVFAFEATQQPMGLLPLLAGSGGAYLVSRLLMHHSIMTEKLARRGTAVRTEYDVDYLSRVAVREAASRDVVALDADDALGEVREWIAGGGTTHHGFPVVDAQQRLVGVVTHRDLLDPAMPPERRVRDVVKRPPAVVYEDHTLREAADHMIREGVGRLVVVDRRAPARVTGVLTRSDLLLAHRPRLEAADRPERSLRVGLRPPQAGP
ncbi:MAG TPA: chloride channel protein [Rubricoccaceae bacterium]|nr:chloride channel protein [Rubricoccaceae bacterium]